MVQNTVGPWSYHAEGLPEEACVPASSYRKPRRSPQVFTWIGDNAKHRPRSSLAERASVCEGGMGYYNVPNTGQPALGQQNALPQRTGPPRRPASALEARSASRRPQSAAPPSIPKIQYPRLDPWGEHKRAQDLLEGAMKKTPRKGWKPWYKHVSRLKGPLGMQQVSPTPDRTPLCTGRGEHPNWDWTEKQPEVYSPAGFRCPQPSEAARQDKGPAPKPMWEKDLERMFTGRKVDKPSTPYTVCKTRRTFGGKDEMFNMLPGVPAYLRAGWRMQRADVRQELDKSRFADLSLESVAWDCPT